MKKFFLKIKGMQTGSFVYIIFDNKIETRKCLEKLKHINGDEYYKEVEETYEKKWREEMDLYDELKQTLGGHYNRYECLIRKPRAYSVEEVEERIRMAEDEVLEGLNIQEDEPEGEQVGIFDTYSF